MELAHQPPSVRGSADRFTGEATITPVTGGQGPSAVQISAVHFAPGARSAWHCHTLGQTLYIAEGTGFVQSRGQEVVALEAGDIVRTPAGEWHWHGASREHSMTNLSITQDSPGAPDQWGALVSDAEYAGG